MAYPPEVDLFDEVRIARTHETEAVGYAGRIGVCHGFTTPSYSRIQVIGEVRNDRGFHVHFEDTNEDAWFATDLVEFVSHAQGTIVGIGDKTFLRNADGSWSPT